MLSCPCPFRLLSLWDQLLYINFSRLRVSWKMNRERKKIQKYWRLISKCAYKITTFLKFWNLYIYLSKRAYKISTFLKIWVLSLSLSLSLQMSLCNYYLYKHMGTNTWRGLRQLPKWPWHCSWRSVDNHHYKKLDK